MKSLIFAIGALGVGALPATALAIPVTGSTSGSFSGASCSSSIAACNASGSTFTFGDPGPFFGYPQQDRGYSQLKFAGQTIGPNLETDFTAPIGVLTWTNRIDLVALLGNEFNVDLSILISLTSPVGSVGPLVVPIDVVETLGHLGLDPDNLTLPDLSALSFSIGPLTIKNFTYSGAGVQDLVWTLAEGSTASININADFVDPPAVPEPTTFALFGVGLIGIGALAQRRGKKMDAPKNFTIKPPTP